MLSPWNGKLGPAMGLLLLAEKYVLQGAEVELVLLMS